MINYRPTFLAEQLIARVRGVIARHDVSQADLAVLCDVSQSQFSKIIRGTRPMSLDQLVVIADALEIDLGAMVAEVEEFTLNYNRFSSPLLYVLDGLRLRDGIARDEEMLDGFGQTARERLEQQRPATIAPEAEDLRDIAQLHPIHSDVPTDERLAAKRGRRKADEPPAD